jgi:hypothetical protein
MHALCVKVGPGISAGLVGAILVSAADAGSSTPGTDGDGPGTSGITSRGREFVNVFLQSDENESPFLARNMWDFLVKASYGDVVSGWVPFGFLDQADVLRALYARAAKDTSAVEQIDYETASALVTASAATRQPVGAVEGVVVGVQFTDPLSNPLDTNSFDPTTYNGRYGDGAAEQVLHALFQRAVDDLVNDEGFRASNRVQTINGFAFCNQPGLVMDASFDDDDDDDNQVVWYSASLGTDGGDDASDGDDAVGLHAPTWSGSPAAGAGAQISAGGTSTVRMPVGELVSGSFTFEDGVLAHSMAGARSTYTVVGAAAGSVASLSATATATRQVFLRAEAVTWDYLPSLDFGQEEAGTVACARGAGSAAPATFSASKFSVGSVYEKWRFVECADAACAATVEPDEAVGVTGPTLRVEVGEVLEVTLFNAVTEELTLRVDGLLADDAASTTVRGVNGDDAGGAGDGLEAARARSNRVTHCALSEG